MERPSTMPRDFDPADIRSNLLEHYKLFRSYLEHEDDLLNHRSTWHITMQGFLFTALGVLLQWKADQVGVDGLEFLRDLMLWIIPVLGACIALAAYLSISAADKALKALGMQWAEVIDAHGQIEPPLPDLAAAGVGWSKIWGKAPSLAIPGLIGATWILIILAVGYHYFFGAKPVRLAANPIIQQKPVAIYEAARGGLAAAEPKTKADLIKEFIDTEATLKNIKTRLRDDFGIEIVPVTQKATAQPKPAAKRTARH